MNICKSIAHKLYHSIFNFHTTKNIGYGTYLISLSSLIFKTNTEKHFMHHDLEQFCEHEIWTVWWNNLQLTVAIWNHRTYLTFIQVMACCLTAPSHYLNKCWRITNEVLWHSRKDIFTENAQDSYLWYEFDDYWFKITASSPQGPMS